MYYLFHRRQDKDEIEPDCKHRILQNIEISLHHQQWRGKLHAAKFRL